MFAYDKNDGECLEELTVNKFCPEGITTSYFYDLYTTDVPDPFGFFDTADEEFTGEIDYGVYTRADSFELGAYGLECHTDTVDLVLNAEYAEAHHEEVISMCAHACALQSGCFAF